ncbi:hypothetical protein ACPW7J_09695 [Ihubacter sp. rT4E-8]|uniref:hypothetical protein n=1 Tax=Ihubacter sp. rT4E-8 TaxID=3242369 RepID=UPI003CF136D5
MDKNNKQSRKIKILTTILSLSLIGNIAFVFTGINYANAQKEISELYEEAVERYHEGYNTGYDEGWNDGANAQSEDEQWLNDDYAETTVYITDTGSKYHQYGCRYLSQSCHEISLSDAKSQGYDACSVCW